jgi:hypothetical protein
MALRLIQEWLKGPVFEPLKAPNGADIAPETLHEYHESVTRPNRELRPVAQKTHHD